MRSSSPRQKSILLVSAVSIVGALGGLVIFRLLQESPRKEQEEPSFVGASEPPPTHDPVRIGRYTFTLEGKPVQPVVLSLDGRPEDPRPGDVIRLPGMGMFSSVAMTLGTQEECRFFAE